jgi:catechol 2,3-dioxygenase
MTGFPISGLRDVAFAVPDLEAAVDFYERIWGLSLADRTRDTAWLRATGGDAYVLRLDAGDRAAIRHATFRAAPDTDLDALLARACRAGGRETQTIPPLDEPGGGTGFAIRDPQGRTLRIVQHDTPAAPLPDDPDRAERLAHVNINSSDVDRDVAFFEAALGFRLTDRSGMMGFVRTNSDHHSVVIAAAAVDTLNHVAFQLPGWEGVMKASGRMVDAGFPIGWGPGRHGPGDNVFVYFVDPHGFVVEHTAEVLQVDDAYRVGAPEDWTWPPGRTDQWGICPPKTAACKQAQLAIPFA